MATAPSFEQARMELYQQLASWTFVKVVRPCVVPADQREQPGDKLPYFHGTGLALNEQRSKVWFKKQPRELSYEQFALGPLRCSAEVRSIPRVGDVLMGKVLPSRQGCDKLVIYYPAATHLHALYELVVNGTVKTEQQLAHDLRAKHAVGGGVDDAWAIARLVLFGNIAAFATQHRGELKPPMRLSMPPLEFIHSCSIEFADPSIWSLFVELVPDAQPPPPPLPPTPPPAPLPPAPVVAPLNLAALPPPLMHSAHPPPFVGRQRRNAKRAPPSPPSQPRTPPYQPQSPPYQPQSPPYQPQSPPYQPQSPPYQPQSPPYSYGDIGYDQPGAYSPPPAPAPPAAFTVESVMSLLQSVAAVQAQQR